MKDGYYRIQGIQGRGPNLTRLSALGILIPAVWAGLSGMGLAEPLIDIQGVEPGSNRQQDLNTYTADETIQEILTLTNTERQAAGSTDLQLSMELNAAAQRHAEDLLKSTRLSHTGSDDSSLEDRVQATGYQYRVVGENLHMQFPRNSPTKAVTAWMDSPGHRRNLLDPNFSDLGLGYATNGKFHYYVQVFAQPR